MIDVGYLPRWYTILHIESWPLGWTTSWFALGILIAPLWTVDWDYKWATMPTDLNIVFGGQIQQQTHQLQRHAPKFSYGL